MDCYQSPSFFQEKDRLLQIAKQRCYKCRRLDKYLLPQNTQSKDAENTFWWTPTIYIYTKHGGQSSWIKGRQRQAKGIPILGRIQTGRESSTEFLSR